MTAGLEPCSAPATPAATLSAEFAGQFAPEVVERVVAAARHALERAQLPCTDETVARLAKEQLRARSAALTGDRRGSETMTVKVALARWPSA